MWQFLRKIFFWDAPAQGAFFGVTLVFTLPWFLLVWIFHSDRIPIALNLWLFTGNLWDATAVVVPAILALVVFVYALFLMWHGGGRRWHFRFNNRTSSMCIVLALAASFGAGWVVEIIWTNLRMELAYTSREHELWDTDVAKWLGLYGNDWAWFTLAGVTLIIAAYLLLGKSLSIVSNTSFKKLWGRSVLALWGLVLASYLFCLAMAFRATSAYHRSVEELAEFFGRPLTAEAVGDLYYGGRKPDAAFWQKIAEHLEKPDEPFVVQINGRNVQLSPTFLTGRPDAVMEEKVYAQWKEHFLANENINQLEAMLDTPLPPAERKYRSDNYLQEMTLDELRPCREMDRLELWRLRFAVETGEDVAAQNALRRMENICYYLQTEPFLLGSLVWIAAEHFRMMALERLIPWEQTETAWLEAQVAKLAELEETLKQVHRKAIFSEAVIKVNWFKLLPAMDRDLVGRPMVKLTAVRWFFPQIWWMFANEAAEMMRAYKISDFSEFPETVGNNWLMGYLSGPPMHKAGTKKFPSLVAELRILRGLIAAELHKRQTGSYPETLEELPIDPFSKQPLKYCKGVCHVQRYTLILQPDKNVAEEEADGDSDLFAPQEEPWLIEPQMETIEAVQIWSVGPDGIDDGGLSLKQEYGSSEKKDDIRFIIPLPSTKRK